MVFQIINFIDLSMALFKQYALIFHLFEHFSDFINYFLIIFIIIINLILYEGYFI